MAGHDARLTTNDNQDAPVAEDKEQKYEDVETYEITNGVDHSTPEDTLRINTTPNIETPSIVNPLPRQT